MINTVQKAAVILALINMGLEALPNPETEQDLQLHKTLLEIKKDCLLVIQGATALDLPNLQTPQL